MQFNHNFIFFFRSSDRDISLIRLHSIRERFTICAICDRMGIFSNRAQDLFQNGRKPIERIECEKTICSKCVFLQL